MAKRFILITAHRRLTTADYLALSGCYNPIVDPQGNTRLVLIDGHSIIHRSFHAMKELREPLKLRTTGELIGAAFGFANTFLSMFAELQPTHVIVALDKAGPTFRHEITETYKATRARLSEEDSADFRHQMVRCRQVIDTFGMPTFELEGFEADDVLGTLSAQAAEHDIDTYLVSLDSDIAQLVRPPVHLWMFRPYQRDSVLYMAEEDVEKRYGVKPHQVPDLKALKGDVSDNIAGVPGVGEKTAVRLMQQFGNVESMLKRIEEIQPAKLREAIRAASDQIIQSRHLAAIVKDAPVRLDMEGADFYLHYDRERVTELFRELEFRTLVPRLPESRAPKPGSAVPVEVKPVEAPEHYTLVRTQEDLGRLARRIEERRSFALDALCSHRSSMTSDLVGLAFGFGESEACYVPIGHAPPLDQPGQLSLSDVLARLGPLLQSTEVQISGHNLKPDLVLLANHGLPLCPAYFDTMIAAYLLGEGGGAGRPEEGALSLRWLVGRRLGCEMPDISELTGNSRKERIPLADVNPEAATAYACKSVDMAWRLRAVLEPELEEKGMRRLFAEIEMPLIRVLARMERNGVAIDTGALREMSGKLAADILRMEEAICSCVGRQFNIGSPQQLSQVLFEELHLPKTRKLKTGAYSTDAQSLENLRGQHEIIDLIYGYRELTKLKSTYLDPLPALVDPRTNRLHTEFNQTGAATGRLSSSNPNLQNIPIRTPLGEQIRRAFVARDFGPESRLLSADYSHVELRIMAHITGDPALVDAFLRDEDIHAATAAQVFGVGLSEVTAAMRRRAKVFNFGVLYGLSEYGLSVRERISREEAAEFIHRYFEKYPGIRRYVDETTRLVHERGYVETLFGRRRYLPEINSPNHNVRQAAERQAVNMPVQGTAADIMKIAMNRMDAEMQRRGMRSLMTLQIHDELMFECPQDELEEMRRMVLDIMPKAMEMKVPLKVETKVGKNWGEMQYGEAVELEGIAE